MRPRPLPIRLLPAVLLALLAASAEGSDGGRWPSFRGPGASGVADGVGLPDRWNAESGLHLRWKAEIPGLAHSSPVVWGKTVFVTTAVSSDRGATFRHGLYGAGTASSDRSAHRWLVLALDLETGERLWQRTAHEGRPKDRRHIKATYANSTPATDGRVVVAFFGSEGVFAYSMAGERLWHRDLGRLDAGAYDAPSYEWGMASSPILHDGLVILQCDTQGQDFVLALDSKTGKTVWRTERDELPSWATPTVVPGGGSPELVTNGAHFIRGYDPRTGEELWRLGGSSKITAPTPIHAEGLTVVASGRRPEKPIFVLRPGARGDLTLRAGETSNRFVAWHRQKRGSYMPTPIAYRGRLYVCENQGILGCYALQTGEELFRQRLPHAGGGFSASPVAADGRLYLPSEDGDVFVVRAGRELEVVAVNPMGERLMATPALADDAMLVRGQHHLFAVAAPRPEPAPAAAHGSRR